MKKEGLDDSVAGYSAKCSIFFLKTSIGLTPRTVSFRSYPSDNIVPPKWCPQREENHGKPCVFDVRTAYEQELESNKKKEDEKENALKQARRRTPWTDIEVGGYYVIPEILGKACRIVYIEEKNAAFLKYREVKMFGEATVYTSTLFKDDVECNFIVKFHRF